MQGQTYFTIFFVRFVAVLLYELESSKCDLGGEVRLGEVGLQGWKSKKKVSRCGRKDKKTHRHPYILANKLIIAQAKGHF